MIIITGLGYLFLIALAVIFMPDKSWGYFVWLIMGSLMLLVGFAVELLKDKEE